MKNFLIIFLITNLFIIRSYCQEKSLIKDRSVFVKTNNYLKEIIDSLEIVGLNYAVLIDNELVHQKAFNFYKRLSAEIVIKGVGLWDIV